VEELLKFARTALDLRQRRKVKHSMSDIILPVFFAKLANANFWEEIEIFAKEHEKFLRQYLELPGGVPSHDTIQRVFAMVSHGFMGKFQQMWNDILSSDEGGKLRKILALDGKTQRGNGNDSQKPNHIVSAVDENGFCLGQKRVDDKSNEITAIPDLLDDLNVAGHIITTDALGTQTEIVTKIRKKCADYVLALKGNQGTLYDDVKEYFADADLLKKCDYTSTVEKAQGGVIKREYWQTDDVDWLPQKPKWAGLKSMAMTKNTFKKNGVVTCETRYFISSLVLDAKEVARAIRAHWMVESFHWHLDVTFREDANHTLDKHAMYNLNIIGKMAINLLKMVEIGGKKLSLSKKRFSISMNVEKHLTNIINSVFA
jgi:predicted transposase YbfD/YdcC